MDLQRASAGAENRSPEGVGGSPARRRSISDKVAAEITTLITEEQMPAGTHLPTSDLAARLKVSRWPVIQALKRLTEQGAVRYERDRGFFVDQVLEDFGAASPGPASPVTGAYLQVAADVLDGKLAKSVSETFLRQRYGLTRAQLSELLHRISQEGWGEPRSGYGWTFTDILTTPQALLQTYEARLIIEPAALLHPNYRLASSVIARTRSVEADLLAGGIESLSPDALYGRAVQFHETLVAGAGNPFLLDALRRVNRVRRLLMYRSMIDRARYHQQSREHLHILDLIEQDRNAEAAESMRQHLGSVMSSLRRIGLL